MIGQTVLHYQIETQIGVGGMGKVYKAHDLKLDRPVALKFPDTNIVELDQMRERFVREAKAISALNHPNIVTIYEINEWDKRLFICMEFVEGKSLAEIVRAQALPVSEALAIARQIVRAVNVVHKKGILHRDLKPSNIMRTPEGLVKVLDFGLAKFVNAKPLTKTGSIMGTWAYIAPEAIQGAPPDQRRDIFAIGVILYELLSGRRPFSGDNEAALIKAVLDQPPQPLREVPRELEAIVMKALEKELKKRYQNLDEILRTLEEIQGVLSYPAAARTATIELKTSATASTIGENPYRHRETISSPGAFYGRKSEVQKIYAGMAGARPQSISVIGMPAMGKSSLLNFLYHPENRQKHLPNPGNYVFALSNFQQTPISSLQEFFSSLLNAVAQERPEKFNSSLSPDYQGFRSLARFLDAHGLRLVILLDGFEAVISNQIFDLDFFDFLQNLANKYNLVYVATSEWDLQSLYHSREVAASPFFSRFLPLKLGVFKPEEARELICAPSAAAGYPLEPFVDEILSLAGFFPLYLQIACSVFFALIKAGQKQDVVMLQDAERLFNEEAERHFKNLLEKFTPAERELLTAIASDKKTDKLGDDLAQKLLDEAYLIEKNGEMKLFSEVFAEYLRKNFNLVSFREKLQFWRRKK